jgi:hypothetical protein
MSLPEEIVGVEVVPDRDAIRDGNAHLLVTKVWGMVDLSHRGSLAKQGLVAVPDGRLVLSFPVDGEGPDDFSAINVFGDGLDCPILYVEGENYDSVSRVEFAKGHPAPKTVACPKCGCWTAKKDVQIWGLKPSIRRILNF